MTTDRRQFLASTALLFAGAAAPRWLTEVRAEGASRGGALRIGFSVEPAGLDPAFGDAPSLDRCIYNLFYDNLFYLGGDGSLQPGLAHAWETSEDGRTITCSLREGVTFHDGSPLDAAAVKASLERVVDPALNAPYARNLAQLDGVDAVDTSTVRIRLKEPSGAIMSALATEPGMIVKASAGQMLARQPIGTGPFTFVSWTGGNNLVARRNPNYWAMGDDGNPLPYLETVEVRFIRNTTVKITEAQAGSIQLADAIQTKDFDRVATTPSLALLPKVGGIHQWMSFNLSKAPFDNGDLRAAVLHAIDRQALARVITGQHGFVTPTLIAPGDWIFDADLQARSFDPEAARAALSRSGYDGTFAISAIQRDPDTQIAQILQAQLQQVGIRARVEILERQAWLDKVLNKNHEMGLLQIHQPRSDPDATFGPSFGRNAAFNWSGVSDERLFDLVEEARATVDRERRRSLYVEIQRRILETDAYGFLFTRPIADIVAASLDGLVSRFRSSQPFSV